MTFRLHLTPLLLLGLLAGGAAPVPAPAARPNFIVILTDDQDLTLGSLDHMPRTRDLIARQGMTFSNYFVPLSLCCPSRATILTGLYPHNHKVYTNFPPDGGFERFDELRHQEATLATALHAAGYRTALIGKYLNGYPNGQEKSWVPPGWDEWASPVGGSPYAAYRFTLNENGQTVKYASTAGDYMTDVLARKATAFVRNAASAAGNGQPFFLFLATFAPHKPSTPAKRHAGLFTDLKAPRTPSFNEADVSDKPDGVRKLPRLTPAQINTIDVLYRKQMLSLQAVDEAVAALVKALQETGALANTYIVFTSDNGFHMGQHRLEPGKYTAYETDIHVPLLIRGPGVAAGSRADALAVSVDLAPTLAELAGARLRGNPDGRSLVPLLRGQLQGQTPEEWRRMVLLEQFAFPSAPPRASETLEPPDPQDEKATDYPAHVGLRTADFKVVAYENGEREVYDLRSDPDELVNLKSRVGKAWLMRLSQMAKTLGKCAGASCLQLEARPVPALP
jgi:N-acetylglucosamine-6-sulfatase